ncbi:Tylosin resistance ATP-binding protein TlrC [Seminavis robusta]|uniref:Tylosin resistance ATP-binding protein TlrC n=1 Tax=Seminavis robusta TaxID=568900 RepID=A0A9N8F1T4_9STRA|nr:Tylosin resistance ATP-binding protein TlrC [Seminavis robusta]|eukprot:Sro2585_g331900.1 Tylosin resistance ATP-binding protein TlrC (974) ;mRNA; r:3002-6106
MARKKNKGGKRRGDDSDEEDAPAPAPAAEEGGKKLSRKQQRLQKQQQKQKQADSDDDDEDLAALLGGGAAKNQYGSDSDSDDMPLPPAKGKKNNNNPKKKGGRMAALAPDSDSEDDDEEEEEEPDVPQPVSKKNSNKKKGGRMAAMAAMAASDSEEEEEELDEDLDDDDEDEEVEQIAMVIMDDEPKKKKKKKKDGEGKEKKKKKDKEGKKDKKEKKKKKKDAEGDPENGEAAPQQKSKLELQIEAALQKKEEEEGATPAPAPPVDAGKKKRGQALAPPPAPPTEVEPDLEDEDGGEEHVVYGAPDDHAWTDKSHAQRDAENKTNEIDDLLAGKDGKKLSNKERKKLLKQKAAAERQAEYEKTAAAASREGAQFACSQTAVNENDPQWQNSLDINIPNFSISAAGKILFKDAALTIAHGRRYGLVGPNGRGKSTLLKMIASRDLMLPPRIDFLYVEQEVVADDTPAVEAVLKADKVRWNLLEEEKTLMEAIDAGDESEEKIERLQVVIDELTNMGSDSAEAKARRILFGLGFSMEMQTKPTKMFSGGWRMRISLARALFVEPTLLMLDEPTNHLDLNAVIWLDDYLQRWKKTLFVISHDQDFLNSVVQEILHIEDLKLISYKGDYDSFKDAEEIRNEQLVKAWEKQEKRLRELKKSGQSKAKATENVKKNQKRESGARSQKKKNQAIAAGSETAEIQELIKRPREYKVQLEFAPVNELSRPVMEVNKVHFRYSPKNPIIFDEIDFGIDMDSRLCVVGPNGAGKSTLLKLLTGEVTATRGEVKRNPRLRMGIYNQHFVDRLPMDVTPIEHLRNRYEDETYQSVRNRLGKYGLEGHAHEVTMRDLSGGQKARVVFVDLSLQEPHILLLDEPTNNLDVETIDALIDAIREFNGGIVVVTHDQRLIDLCECDLWVVEKQGVTKWEAGFDDYKANILRQLEEEAAKEAAIRQQKIEAAAKAKAEKVARLAGKVKKGKK